MTALTPWHTFELAPIRAAEWTYVEGAVRLPSGASRVAPMARGEVATDQVMLDELFVRPEDLP